MSVRLLEGFQATAALDDADFQAAWDRLFERCAWASAFQSRHFVTRWYGAHRGYAAPVIGEVSSGDQLIGLAFWARGPDGALNIAGGDMAHEHGWLALPLRGSFALEAILSALVERFNPSRICFSRLPKGAPMDWLGRGRPFGQVARSKLLRAERVTLDPARAKKKLDKRGNVSQVPFLRQLGPISLVDIQGDDLERSLRRFIRWREERRIERGRKTPYLSDPDSMSLLVALAKQEGPLKLTALQIGDRIVSVIAVYPGHEVAHLEFFAEAPEMEQHAPSMVHIHMLEERLLAGGARFLDVTRDDEWMYLVADQTEARGVDLLFERPERLLTDIRAAAVSASKRLLRYL